MTVTTRYFCFITLTVLCGICGSNTSKKCFPPNFKFGVGTSAYQVEGGWNEDGKGENIWDHFTHYSRDKILDKSDANVTDDSYHKYKEDIVAVKMMGAKVYRFSISWARVLPTGDVSNVNTAGIAYYNNLINELLKNDIEPFVTLYHWDLPQILQERYGGWSNKIMVDYFGNYSRFIFEQFGDRVKNWVTFNEPNIFCLLGYGEGAFAPGLNNSGIDDYMCAHTVLNSHARAYHVYDKEFKAKQEGKVGFTIAGAWYEPASTCPDDVQAAERARAFHVLLYAYPILHGRYPDLLEERIGKKSAEQGLPKSRLPEFTAEESEAIKNTYDFGTVNHYYTIFVKHKKDEFSKTPSFNNDISIEQEECDFCPWGLRKLLNWAVKMSNNHTDIIITENGLHDNAHIEDVKRIKHHKGFLESLLESINYDHLRVISYMAWSLMDNFEWNLGYTKKYGFFYVSGDDPERKRVPKHSVQYINKVFTTKCLE